MKLSDADIREPLFEFLEEKFGKVRIIEEKQVNKSRADVMLVTPDALLGFEIKSDKDTYERLARQVKDYNLFFDFNYVVVGTTHAKHIGEHVPDSWGIITVERDESGAIDFYILREALRNRKRRMPRKLSFLWKSELAHILAAQKMPKYAGKSKKFIGQKLMEKVPEDALERMISEELFERDYTIYGEEE